MVDANDVRRYGVVGDGVADDTAALQLALSSTRHALHLPSGRYRITRSLIVDLANGGPCCLRGSGATIINDGTGPAVHIKGYHKGTSRPDSMTAQTLGNEIMPLVDGLAIVGNHPQADGIKCTGTLKLIITHALIRACRYGIHVAERNRDIIFDTCHVLNNQIGIYLDHVDLHQINIVGSHISHNSGGGIKVEEGAIRNIQICGNDIEYNYRDGGADVWFMAGEGAIREATIVGNTIQALPGEGGVNILIQGYADKSPNKVGYISISANHISNQTAANIHIKHGRGIVIQGNTFQGADRNIVIEDSASVAVSQNVLDDNPDYGANRKTGIIGSITLENSRYCQVQGNILTRPYGGGPQRGGAIEAFRCAFLNITGNTVIGPANTGVWLEDTTDSIVTQCIVAPGEGVSTMPAAIAEAGACRGNMITGNKTDVGA